MVFAFLENAWNLRIFTHAPFLSQNFSQILITNPRGREKLLIPLGEAFSKTSFPQQQKRVEETMICFIKIQSENMKMTWNIRFLYLVRFAIFSNVMHSQFCKEYLSNIMVLVLLSLSFKCHIIILKLSLKLHLKIATLSKGGNAPEMINKEVLAQFIYKPA